MAEITPFNISIPDEVLSDLKTRLNLTRYPVNVELSHEEEWSYGAPMHNVKQLVEYWKTAYDWRKVEADINQSYPQFMTSIDAEDPHGELKIHFVHKRSTHPNAIPLLFVHGWPGNFLEVGIGFTSNK